MTIPVHLNIQDAVRFHQAGRLDEAESIYRGILAVQPGNSDALHLLGVIAYQKRRMEEAAGLILKAIACNKRAPEYRNNLGNVYLAQGRYDEAAECYRKAVKLNPNYIDAHNNLGTTLKEQGRLQEAAGCYERALKVDPRRADIHNHLGLVFEKMGRIEEAITHFRESVRLKPDFCDALSNLGSAYKIQGRMAEAVNSCNEALKLNPRHARALLNLGNICSESGDLGKGIELFRNAILSDPALCEAHMNLGLALRETGDTAGSEMHFRKALDLQPSSIVVRMAHCIGRIPLVHDSEEAITATRDLYGEELENLSRDMDLSDPRVLSQAARLVGNYQPFFLAYQGRNDRELQSLYGSLMARIQAACFPKWAKPVSMPPVNPGEPLRIGILSGFFFLHSNWKIPIKGWIENLNREDFQLYGYYTGQRADSQTDLARRSFYRFVENMPTFEQWCEVIARDRLHVLIIPEAGMDPMTVRLASLRLAPVQCGSWGHPDTSGLPTMDYYLSSDLMEPPEGDDHYTEKLVRLPNLSIYYEPLSIPSSGARRQDFGLSETSVLFLCAQSLFKYLPQYDEVFPRIALEVSGSQFAFLNYHKSPELGVRFARRLQAAFSKFGLNSDDYIKFLPSLDPHRYRALNEIADVFLDSIGWSGCNSTLEALACNLPVVTMPGRLMRGRHTHAILKMMDYVETEAENINEYVAIAKRLALDLPWRKHVSGEIAARKHRLYCDTACIRGLEQFLKQAVVIKKTEEG